MSEALWLTTFAETPQGADSSVVICQHYGAKGTWVNFWVNLKEKWEAFVDPFK